MTGNLSAWSIKHRVLILFFMILFLAAGAFAYINLGREEDPSFAVSTMVVSAAWPGASLVDTMNELTNTLEEKLEETPEPRRHQELHDAGPDGHLRPAPRFDPALGDPRRLVPGAEEGLRHQAEPARRHDRALLQRRVWRRLRHHLRPDLRRLQLARGARLRRDRQGGVPLGYRHRQGRYLRRAGREDLPDLLAGAARRDQRPPRGRDERDRGAERGDAGGRDHHAERGHPDRRLGRTGRHGEPRGDQPLHQRPLLQPDPARDDQRGCRSTRRPRCSRSAAGRRSASASRCAPAATTSPSARRSARSRRSSSRTSRSASTSCRSPTSPRWCGPRSPASPARCSRRWSSCSS